MTIHTWGMGAHSDTFNATPTINVACAPSTSSISSIYSTTTDPAIPLGVGSRAKNLLIISTATTADSSWGNCALGFCFLYLLCGHDLNLVTPPGGTQNAVWTSTRKVPRLLAMVAGHGRLRGRFPSGDPLPALSTVDEISFSLHVADSITVYPHAVAAWLWTMRALTRDGMTKPVWRDQTL